MAYDLNQLRSLVESPSESLTVELKGWLDPKTPAHVAKIAKALLALRNQNGGHLIFGLDAVTSALDTKNPKPADIRQTYHTDEIQLIVSRYSSELFPVEVHFIESKAELFPVVCVPPGTKTVVAAKQNLVEGATTHIKQHQVYVRTLRSNGTPSTSEARHDDWASIMEVCMDNREADVARFLRRHFGDRDVAGAINALGTPKAERLRRLQLYGLQRFNTVVNKQQEQVPSVGWWDVSAIIDGTVPPHRCNQDFLNLLIRSNPRITGWPLFLAGQSLRHAKNNESPFEGAWECSLVMPPSDDANSFARNIDYWRVTPAGEMYALRMLEDDLLPTQRQIKPLVVLDFAIVIWRTTEALLVPMAFAKAMGCDADQCSIDYLFSWSRLQDRGLSCWSDMRRALYFGKSQQDSINSTVKVPLATARTAIAPYVHQVVQPLFELFGGADIKMAVIESIVNEVLKAK